MPRIEWAAPADLALPFRDAAAKMRPVSMRP
ncbi:hypothetical protein OJF2_65430 [Aquisphaera giovannonii]|uniref:Uncharacterized protein n=1 Tax=Aquisphaera giovannonii TaxID=406548 RepID=A0A5B9WBQ7_9BACT|nr:hypothetical protein OJF2_65430 [Aquisphaera giovannonii]